MSFTIFFFLFLATAVVSLIVSHLAWRRRSVPAAKELSWLMFFVAFYAFFIAFEAASTSEAEKIMWSKIAYLGAVMVPVLYYIFIVTYTGETKSLTRKNRFSLFILPLITLLLTLTNEYHHLVWTGFSRISPTTNLMKYDHGEWFFIGYMVYDYVLLFFATISLYNFIHRHKNTFRTQGLGLLIAGVCPWIAGIVYVTNGNPIAGFDIAPVTTGLCGVLLIFAILRNDFLDLVPIAREMLVETLQDGILALDAKNRVQDINRAACLYLGLSGNTVLGMTIHSCGIHSDRLLEAIVSPESNVQFEMADKEDVKTFSIFKQDLKKETGGRLIVIRDISEQIAIHKEILATKERYRKMYHLFRLMSDNMSDMIWAKDLEKKFIFANKSICDEVLKAANTDEPIGKTALYFKELEQQKYPANQEFNQMLVNAESTDEKVLLSGKPEQFEEFGIVGGIPFFYDIQKAPIFDDHGEMIGIVGSARNVTRQKMNEREILHRDRLLDAISKAMGLLIQGESIEDSLCQSFKIIGQAIGLNRVYMLRSFLNSDNIACLEIICEWMDDFAKKLSTNRVSFVNDFLNDSHPNWHKSLTSGRIVLGKTQDFILSEKVYLESQGVKSILLVPVFIDKRFWGIVGFDDCTTERVWTTNEEHLLTTTVGTIVTAYVRKKSQDDLLIAKERAEESDRLKTAFLSNLSHEIRTPMNSILGFVSLLQEPGLTGVEKEQYINFVKEGGDRLLNTIHDIIDIAKIESNQMSVDLSEVDINDLALALYSMYEVSARAKGLVFNQPLLASSDYSLIKTDKNKIYSILSNLIKNAIKYTHFGHIEVGLMRNSSGVLFYVRDTGIGIPEDKRASIFERFVQVDVSNSRIYEGVGLGLSISKAYVEMLGGKIWFESKMNTGSTFYFQIPVSE